MNDIKSKVISYLIIFAMIFNVTNDMIPEIKAKDIGEDNDISQECNMYCEYQSEIARSYIEIIDNISRTSVDESTLLSLEEQLSADLNDLTTEEVQIARAEVLAYIYESVARTPENEEILTKVFVTLLGEKINTSNKQIQAAYAKSYSSLIEGIARQPEAKDMLLSIEKNLSVDITDFSCEEFQIARAEVLSSLYVVVSRQPEIQDVMVSVFIDLVGNKINTSNVNVQAAYVKTYGIVMESIARMPEFEVDLLSIIEEQSVDITQLNTDEVQLARAEVIGYLYEAIARNPYVMDKTIRIFEDLLGEKVNTSNVIVQAEYAKSYSKLMQAIARQPDEKDEFLSLVKKYSVDITNFETSELQIARAEVIRELYTQVSRYTQNKEIFVEVFVTLLGEKINTSDINVQASYARSYGVLIESFMRMPEEMNELLSIEQELSIDITNFETSELQIARAEVLGYLYQAVTRVPEYKNEFTTTFVTLLGNKVSTSNPEIQAAYAKSYELLIQSIARDSSAMDMLLSIQQELSVDLTELDSVLVQKSRAYVLGKLYKYVSSYRDEETKLVDLFIKLLGNKVTVDYNSKIKELIENITFNFSENLVKNENDLKLEIANLINNIEEIQTMGIIIKPSDIIISNFKSAHAETNQLGDGLNGGYDFDIKIQDCNKIINIKNSGIISYKRFVVSNNTNTLKPVKDRLENLIFDISELDSKDEYELINNIKNYLSKIVNYNSINIDVISINYIEAVGGTKENPNGKDGKLNFIIKLSNGLNIETTKELELIISANKYIKYEILKGDNQIIKIGIDDDCEFKINGDIDKFVGLYFNDKLVDSSNYSLTKGSIIINLNNNYIESLPIGKHKFIVKFIDGEATVNIEVKRSENSNIDNLDTDDNSCNLLLISTLLLIIIGISFMIFRKFKNNIT